MQHLFVTWGMTAYAQSLERRNAVSGLAALTPMLSVIASGPPATRWLSFRLMTDFDRDRKAAERLAGIVTLDSKQKEWFYQ